MGFPWLSQTLDLTTFIFGGLSGEVEGESWVLLGSSLHSQELRKLLKMTGLCFKNLGQQNQWILCLTPDTPARHLKSLITLYWQLFLASCFTWIDNDMICMLWLHMWRICSHIFASKLPATWKFFPTSRNAASDGSLCSKSNETVGF